MRIALVGYGRMGRALEALAPERGHEVVARIDPQADSCHREITPEVLSGVEVALEFTLPDRAPENLRTLARHGVDVVCGTTGWGGSLDEVARVVEDAGTALLHASNFSLGVQVMNRLVELAARLADPLQEYDPHLLEIHHRHKVDHPSGTARALADIVLAGMSRKTRWELGPGEGPVEPAVLQVNAVRAGENPGEHLLALEGPDDVIQIRHRAKGRAGFARGALAGAEWLKGRKGMFTLDDMMADVWT